MTAQRPPVWDILLNAILFAGVLSATFWGATCLILNKWTDKEVLLGRVGKDFLMTIVNNEWELIGTPFIVTTLIFWIFGLLLWQSLMGTRNVTWDQHTVRPITPTKDATMKCVPLYVAAQEPKKGNTASTLKSPGSWPSSSRDNLW